MLSTSNLSMSCARLGNTDKVPFKRTVQHIYRIITCTSTRRIEAKSTRLLDLVHYPCFDQHGFKNGVNSRIVGTNACNRRFGGIVRYGVYSYITFHLGRHVSRSELSLSGARAVLISCRCPRRIESSRFRQILFRWWWYMKRKEVWYTDRSVSYTVRCRPEVRCLSLTRTQVFRHRRRLHLYINNEERAAA